MDSPAALCARVLLAGTWTIPAERMKGQREHVVPLAPAAVAVVERRRGLHPRFVFASERTGRPLTHAGLSRTVANIDGTIHGFRSNLRTWASEETDHDHAVVETALLAHAVGSAVKRPYRRGCTSDS